jgi:seryl-tRNA synthetase N-terminal domain
MLDIKYIRENIDIVKENIRKKNQDEKLELVDRVVQLDELRRENIKETDAKRARRNEIADLMPKLFKENRQEEANILKEEAKKLAEEIKELEKSVEEETEEYNNILLTIPNIMHESVPVGKDDSENVEIRKYLEPKEKSFEVPYHLDILEKVGGIDLDAARRVAGSGFYYLDRRYCKTTFSNINICKRFHDR